MSINFLAWLAYLFFLLILSFCKTIEIFLPQIVSFEIWLGGDKWTHFILAFVLGFLTGGVARGRQAFYLHLVLVIGFLLDETHQFLLETRRFEWLDLVYGIGGLLSGCCLYVIARYFLLKMPHFKRDNV